MSAGPEQYKGKLTPEEEAHIMTLQRPEDITAYMHELEVQAGLRIADPFNKTVLHEVEQPAPASQLTASFTVNGKEYTFTGNSQADIDAQQVVLFRSLSAAQSQLQTTNDTVARTADGRFAKTEQPAVEDSALRAAELANLELRFKRGEVSAADYIKQSGAMDEYLASRGIDVAEHQRQLQTNQSETQAWVDATKQFIKNNPDWTGGDALKDAMGQKIFELGLTKSPSVESLERCYSALALEAEISTCQDPYRLAELREQYRQQVHGVVRDVNATSAWGRPR